MKRLLLAVFSVMLIFSLAACSSGETSGDSAPGTTSPTPESTAPVTESTPPSTEPATTDEASQTDDDGSKILIAYFSSAGNIVTDEQPSGNVGHGNTKLIADMIAAEVGGELFFIEVAEKYPANYNDTIAVAMDEQRADARPPLATEVESFEDYDVIFLGYPNWWGTLPHPVLTFLDSYDFSGKTVIPFCTHEGSGFGRSIGDLEDTLPDATLLDGFVVAGRNAGNAGDDVIEWLDGLNLPE